MARLNLVYNGGKKEAKAYQVYKNNWIIKPTSSILSERLFRRNTSALCRTPFRYEFSMY